MKVYIERGMKASPQSLSRKLIELQYERNDMILKRGGFRIKGDVMEIHPAYTADAYRIETSWDVIEKISRISPVSAEIIENLDVLSLYAAKHFVMPEDEIKKAAQIIKKEAEERYEYFVSKGKLVEAQRIKSRTDYDMEMLEEMGYCSGIENYSLHLTGRKSGDRPAVLLDYFPEKFLTFIDESHVTVPQIGGMFEGDKARKQNLVDFGFRLPSAMDNRPLYYGEFESILDRTIFVSATPSREEAAKAQALVEQIIRPTGLLDPEIFIRKTEGQMEDLYAEIRKRIEAGERTLVTTLTKKMAEDLTDFFAGLGLKVRYLHSDIETIERVEILKDLRTGTFDVLVGINLLREGLDLPEVSLVAILDADKIGFLRSATSLIQTIGRAARNVNGTVIMYADRISDAMETAVGETDRRRKIQQTYNDEHGITPRTIKKAVQDIILRRKEEKRKTEYVTLEILKNSYNIMIPKEKKALIKALEEQMLEHARRLEFEEAALVRDEIQKLKGLD
jgi:excinuclease ABC subunit B